MKVAIMQPYFFPYIGYWQLINAVDKFVIYDDVNFIKGGWINRNNILVNGETKLINLRMDKASPNKLINEIEIDHNEIYMKKLLKTINQSYSKAPFFEEVFQLVKNVTSHDETNLARYLEFSIRKVNEYLGINTEILLSSEIKKSHDFKGQDKVLEMCKILCADQYINAIGGQDLYSKEDFISVGIELDFLKTKVITYQQFITDKFVPSLSVIDVMMFNDKERVKSMLEKYVLL